MSTKTIQEAECTGSSCLICSLLRTPLRASLARLFPYTVGARLALPDRLAEVRSITHA